MYRQGDLLFIKTDKTPGQKNITSILAVKVLFLGAIRLIAQKLQRTSNQ